eukprot:m.56633 g.56633  ORF g.56633 m.56633 type:complete len:435 (-) comp7023_c0_seq1:486-1790(-)
MSTAFILADQQSRPAALETFLDHRVPAVDHNNFVASTPPLSDDPFAGTATMTLDYSAMSCAPDALSTRLMAPPMDVDSVDLGQLLKTQLYSSANVACQSGGRWPVSPQLQPIATSQELFSEPLIQQDSSMMTVSSCAQASMRFPQQRAPASPLSQGPPPFSTGMRPTDVMEVPQHQLQTNQAFAEVAYGSVAPPQANEKEVAISFITDELRHANDDAAASPASPQDFVDLNLFPDADRNESLAAVAASPQALSIGSPSVASLVFSQEDTNMTHPPRRRAAERASTVVARLCSDSPSDGDDDMSFDPDTSQASSPDSETGGLASTPSKHRTAHGCSRRDSASSGVSKMSPGAASASPRRHRKHVADMSPEELERSRAIGRATARKNRALRKKRYEEEKRRSTRLFEENKLLSYEAQNLRTQIQTMLQRIRSMYGF